MALDWNKKLKTRDGRPARTLKHIKAFLAGVREFRRGVTTHLPTYSLQQAYDWGREWAHRLTFRRFET